MRRLHLNIILILLALVSMPTLNVFAKTINSNTNQSGTERLTENLTINARYTINGNLEVTKNLSIGTNGELIINGSLTINGDFEISGDGKLTINENGELHVNSDFDAEYTTTGLFSRTYHYPTIEVDGSMIVNGKLTSESNMTVNGQLEVGEANIKENLNIGESASMVVLGELNVKGDIVVNGKLEAGEIFVDNHLTINEHAILYVNKDESDSDPNGKLTINRGGEVTFNNYSTAIIEGDIEQDDNTIFSILGGNNTGSIDAQDATIVVEGNYIIYSNVFGYVDSDCEVIDPGRNSFYVFGDNDLWKTDITATPGDEAAFQDQHGDIKSFVNHILPIELVYFTADEIGGGVRFAWETASELNNDYFTIEFSIDAVEFTELTTIEGAGTSTEPHFYRYSDFSSNCGVVYYRLKQTDFDGNYSYSKIVSVVFADNQITDSYNYFIYPNPATDRISIGGGKYESITFVSVNGKILRREAALGSHDITRLPKGMNYVIIHTANGDVSESFIKR